MKETALWLVRAGVVFIWAKLVFGLETAESVDSRAVLPAPRELSTFSELEQAAPRPTRTMRKPWGNWWSKGDDKEFQSIWPPRTKQDLSIRRSRAGDMFRLVKRNKDSQQIITDLALLGEGLDYVTVLNLSIARCLFGKEWWTNMHRLGALDSGLDGFVEVTKWLSNTVKTRGLKTNDWTRYVECQSLTGYRNLPFPGFDVAKDATDLANGGLEHDFPDAFNFEDCMREALPMADYSTTWMSLEEYIRHGDWLTSGSSSVGTLWYVDADGKVKHVKARKNFVLDVFSVDELVRRVVAYDGRQINKVLIKSELGKVRLAVASDLETYLVMSWITRYIGDVDNQWYGNTMNETMAQQNDRMAEMITMTNEGYYCVPFDYKGFERQPKLRELKSLSDHYGGAAVRNVANHIGGTEAGILRHYVSKVTSSFDTAILINDYASDGKRLKEPMRMKVTGGLMSGIRWTSKVGNGWNATMTRGAKKAMQQSGVDVNVKYWIKGDDSALFFKRLEEAQLFVWTYNRLGVVGSEGKYGLHKGATEFLRIWFDTHAHGYPCRALPGLTQRKPWSSEPWSPENVIRAIYEATNTLERRGVDCRELWQVYAGRWCNLHHVPKAILQIPKSRGGLGVTPWDGETIVSPPVAVYPKARIEIKHQTRWRQDKLAVEAIALGIKMTDDDLAKLSHEQLEGVLGSDDLPQVASLLRKKWKEETQLTKFRVTKAAPFTWGASSFRIPRITARPGGLSYAQTLIRSQITGNFGRYSRDVAQAVRAKPFLRYSGQTLRSYIRTKLPRLDAALIGTKGAHLGEALDWFGGKVEMASGPLHPALKQLLVEGCLASLTRSYLRGSHTLRSVSKVRPLVEATLRATECNTRLWNW